jgi:hypothetical protein
MPNLPKYKGRGNPLKHVKEFFTNCIDLAHEPTYLMRLFPQSLTGQALEGSLIYLREYIIG